jgi:CubicO group peptidase (beta-lactamase class C family)
VTTDAPAPQEPTAIDDELSAGIRALLDDDLAAGRFSGAACAVAIGGVLRVELYRGTRASFGPDGAPLPPAEQSPVDAATVFDLASVTKIFTAHTALALVDAGIGELDAPLADTLPAYRAPVRDRVTLRHLLTHTSGLPATWDGWREPLARWLEAHPDSGRLTTTPLTDRDRLIADLLETPLEAEPGARFEYACTGYNTAMAYFEALTGESWRALLARHTLRPLGLTRTTADPEPGDAVATEYQPQFRRGVVKGVVHDETSWSLGGGTGNAGLFTTARELLRFGEAIRRGEGRVRGEWMWDDALSGTLGRPTTEPDGGFGSALGLRIGDAAFMGEAPAARGHTGFTGTSVHIDREAGLTIALLTNRVHPSREGTGSQELRRRVAELATAAAGPTR